MVIFIGLNLLDGFLTWLALGLGMLEINWYRYLFELYPVVVTLGFKFLLAGICCFLVYRHKRSLFRPLNVGMGVVVGVNLVGILVTLL